MQRVDDGCVCVCKQAFSLYEYDEDGYCTEQLVQIDAGSRWVEKPHKPLLIAGEGSIRLESIAGDKWIEVTPGTFGRFFERSDKKHIWEEPCDWFRHMKRIEAAETGYCQRCRVNPECQFSR